MLRTYKLGEADRIVVLLTEEHGKVRAVAKGVRKTTSKFGARLEPMSHVRLLLYQGRELDIVSQAESVEPLAPLLVEPRPGVAGDGRARGGRPAGAGARAERRSCTGCSSACCARSPSAPAPLVVPAFYWKLLAAEGLRPELDACVRCGEAEPDVALVAFDLDEGGVLCRSCRPGTPISAGGAGAAARRSSAAGSTTRSRAPESPATHEVGVLATRALEHHIERRLRAVAMFERH